MCIGFVSEIIEKGTEITKNNSIMRVSNDVVPPNVEGYPGGCSQTSRDCRYLDVDRCAT